jgi:diacylglycerol kinase (ATP)
MTSIGVVAHEDKILGGGLNELRRLLADRGFSDPIWYQVSKSRKAPHFARKAIDQGPDLLFIWGGDGAVQRCLDTVAGTDVSDAVLPAGTANLLATNLKVPIDPDEAVEVGLHGARRRLDLGVMNGKRFAVMAGAGSDAIMMHGADGMLKKRFGQVAYMWTGARTTRMKARKMKVKVDGEVWFKGRAGCLLLGNMGTLTDGLSAFPNARPDDGKLDVGVVTAEGVLQWARVLGRLATGHADRSPLAHMTSGRQIDVRIDRATVYELDGGTRPAKRHLRATVEPGAVTICVPEDQGG